MNYKNMILKIIMSTIWQNAYKNPKKQINSLKKGLILHFLTCLVLYQVLFSLIRGLSYTMIAAMVIVLLVDVALNVMRGRTSDSDILWADIIGLCSGVILVILVCATKLII